VLKKVKPLQQKEKHMKAFPKPQHGSLEWKQQRWRDANGRCVFGASDAPVLMGASPYKTRGDLFVEKLNEPSAEQIDNDVFYRGNLLEPSLVQHAMNQLGIELVTPDVVYRDNRWSISMDGVDNESSPTIGIECKTTTRYTIETEKDLPLEWRWQGWAQMCVLNVPIFFSVLDARQRVRFVELNRDEQAIDALQQTAELFGVSVDNNSWDNEIETMTAEQIARLFPSTDDSIELPVDALTWVDTLAEARQMKKQGEELERQAKDNLARMLKNASVGVVNGVSVVSWKQTAGKKSVSIAELREHHPDIVQKFERVGEPYRTMRVLTKPQ